MGSASKEKMMLARAEASERLRALATQLEQGTIALGDKAFAVPEQVRLEIEADSDELEIELTWKASATEQRSEEQSESESLESLEEIEEIDEIDQVNDLDEEEEETPTEERAPLP